MGKSVCKLRIHGPGKFHNRQIPRTQLPCDMVSYKPRQCRVDQSELGAALEIRQLFHLEVGKSGFPVGRTENFVSNGIKKQEEES